MSNLHNPQNLPPEQVGVGWRLLTEAQKDDTQPNTLEVWNLDDWQESLYRGTTIPEFQWVCNTYRVRGLSPLVSRIADEIAKKVALLEILPMIEAGAEWEVKSVDEMHPPESREWHTSSLKVDSYINDPTWLIRLKPAPEPAPLWDCVADVPLNAWLRWKSKPNELYSIVYHGVDGVGVVAATRKVTVTTFESWDALGNSCEYTLDGVTFHPCRKGGPR